MKPPTAKELAKARADLGVASRTIENTSRRTNAWRPLDDTPLDDDLADVVNDIREAAWWLESAARILARIERQAASAA